MKNECIAAVERAAGRSLSKAEIDGIETRMTTALRDLSTQRADEFMAMSPAERVVEAAKIAKERMMKDVAAAQETEVRNAQIRAGLDNYRQQFKPGLNGQLKAVMQRFFYDAGSKANETSVEMNRKAIMGDFMRFLSDVRGVDAGKFFGMMQDLTKRDAIFKELAGEASNDPEARKVAQTFLDVNKMAAQRAERAGIGFHELDNWRSPQPVDWTKVALNKDAWLKDHMAWVDRRAYVMPSGERMNDTQLADFLGRVWETQATNGANKRAEGEGSGYAGLGTSRKQPRQIHYKDAASYTEAMNKYGRASNVYSLFMQHLNGLSRDISIAETLGRDHETNFSRMVEAAFAEDIKAVKTEKDLRALDAMKGRAMRSYDLLARGEGVGNQTWALRMGAIRSVISSTMLGGLFGAVPDFAMTSLTAKMNGIPQLRAMAQSMKGIVSKSDGEMLERVGLSIEGMQAAAHRFGIEELGAGTPALLNEAVHKLSLLGAFDRGMRSGIGLSMMDLLGKLTRDKTLADLQGGDHEFLVGSKGVTEKHWAVWKAAEVDKGADGKRTILSPDGVYRISDSDMLPIVQNDIAARSAVYADAVKKLNEQTAREESWLSGAWDKFNDWRDKTNRLLKEYDERGIARIAEAQSGANARGGLMLSRIAKAEVEAEIAKTAAGERSAGQMTKFFDDIKRGVENYGKRRSQIGEKLGARRRQLQEDINNIEKRNRADQKVFDTAEASATTKMRKVESELNAYLRKLNNSVDEKIEKIQRGNISDATATRFEGQIERMSARMDKRTDKFIEWRNAIKMRRSEATARNDARVEVELAKIDELSKKIDLAEAQHDIEAYLVAEKNRDALQNFADNISWRNKQLSDRSFTVGERLGARRAELDARIKELDARVARQEEAHGSRVSEKAGTLDKRAQEVIKGLTERADEYQDRALKRADYVRAYMEKFGKIEGEEIERAKSDAVTKLLATTLSEIQAGARGAAGASIIDKVALGLDQAKAGTVNGEIYRMFLLMKQTPLGIAYTHLFQRPAALDSMKSAWMYRAQFMAYSTLLGAVSIQLKAMATGEDPSKITEGKFWAKSLMAGGGMGIYGDLLFGGGAHTTNGLAGLLGGPGASAAEDAWRLYNEAGASLMENGQYKYGSKFLEFGRKYAAPLTNIWYLKAAFNHLIYHNLQEMLDPGWAARLQSKMQKKHGASYWWSPGGHGPDRAPDLSNMVR